MRNNLTMVPHLTLIIHPSIQTGGHTSSVNNCFEFRFDRSRLLKFFKELISSNPNLQICYSFNVPPAKSKNRLLANEVPISFACILSFAEAAAHKGVPIYLYPLGTSHDTSAEAVGQRLSFHDFKNIFDIKLDQKSAHEIRKTIQVVGPATDVSYPADFKAKKNDEKSLDFVGHINVRPISSENVVDLLAKGTNIVVPNDNNEYVLMTLIPQSTWFSKDNFGLSWKIQTDESASCGAIRVPIVVKSNEIFYSKRGTDFMTVFKKEMEEFSQKNKSSASSNPFHNEAKETPVDEVPSDSEYHEVSNAQYEIPKTSTDNQTTVTSGDISSKSAPVAGSNEVATDAVGPLSARQLSSFLNQFKEEMKEQLVGMVEDTVKKYSAKDKAANVSESEQDADACSVINVSDCVKSEADDSDLPKLLNTLSQIEEQLSSIEKAANSELASARPHSFHHRRRDFSSLTRRATLGILKKRMKGSVVEFEPDLFAISKAGFKLKMARNATQTFRFVLFKYGKYRNTKFEVDFTPTIVPNGIECCIKPYTKSQEKTPVDDKGQYTFYDVRFKSKERTGKFRCFLKILRNGKVCGNALCITVRVKRFHSATDAIDSAEEALPCYPGVGGFEPTSPANVDIDEGISVFQEYPSSVSSDSEDGEATNRDNDNDEGIDTKLDASCTAFEKLSIKEKRPFPLFDEDSDSSVSLLLDENEVREVVDKNFDSVKIPPCFIPNADMSKEPMSVRVKRKLNSSRKKKSDSPTAILTKNPAKSKDWWEFVRPDQLKNTETSPTADDPLCGFLRFPRETLVPQQHQFPQEQASPRHAKETENSGKPSTKSETASKGTYKLLYPSLDEVLETPSKSSKKTSPAKESQSPVAILPEKVFEMTSNVFKSVMNSMKQPNEVRENMQKNIDETLWSISRSVFGSPNPAAGQPSREPRTAATAPPASPATQSQVAPPSSAAGAAPKPPAQEQPVWAASTAPKPPAQEQSVWAASTAPKPPAQEPPVWAASGAPKPPSQEQPVWDGHGMQLPKPAPISAPVWGYNTMHVPKPMQPVAGPCPPPTWSVFSFADPRYPPVSAFRPPPPHNPHPSEFAFNFTPQSATVGTNTTPNVASSPMAESVNATDKRDPLESAIFREQPHEPTPPNVGINVPEPEIAAAAASAAAAAAATSAEIPLTAPIPGNPLQQPQTGFHSFVNETKTTSTPSTSPSKSPKRTGLIAGEEYNRLQPEVRQKILQLNEMGFMNDSYNLFLIRKYPQDMDKVVESLVNYNDR